jgi:hypothetical protein
MKADLRSALIPVLNQESSDDKSPAILRIARLTLYLLICHHLTAWLHLKG